MATDIANTNLMPGYLVRLQFITDSVRASQWAMQTGDSTRWKKFLDPSLRKQLLDTMHKATAHITIPFGPRPQVKTVLADTTKRKITDTTRVAKSDSSDKPKRKPIRQENDSAALKPKDKPVVQKDSSTNQSP
jgi:hypothetical protein